jgi:phytoene dehydrogenase-like protein
VFERIQNPLYFAEKHGNYKGSLYGPDEEYRLWGIFPLANRDPRYGNVAYCGGAVQPGAGLPMATLSGQFAVQVLGKSRR